MEYARFPLLYPVNFPSINTSMSPTYLPMYAPVLLLFGEFTIRTVKSIHFLVPLSVSLSRLGNI